MSNTDHIGAIFFIKKGSCLGTLIWKENAKDAPAMETKKSCPKHPMLQARCRPRTFHVGVEVVADLVQDKLYLLLLRGWLERQVTRRVRRACSAREIQKLVTLHVLTKLKDKIKLSECLQRNTLHIDATP